jgi:ATP/ADP translocase
MLVLTLIRILRDTLGLVAAIGFVLTWVVMPSPIATFFIRTEWSSASENWRFTILFTASLAAFAAWFFVQRKERVLARMHLTNRSS